MEIRELIQKLINLQNAYARTYRMTVTSERLRHFLAREGAGSVDIHCEDLREPLLEHIGHLPVIASFLHPHITHSKEVNLGRVLTMLSIHDIGETVTGDVLVYKKTRDQESEEKKAARKLLSEDLQFYFDEFEGQMTLDAKYAKSVDSLAPFLHRLNTPRLARKIFIDLNFSSKDVEARKRAIFEWDSVLAEIFEIIIDSFRRIERGESIKFTGATDLGER